jgi:hypothetical protein
MQYSVEVSKSVNGTKHSLPAIIVGLAPFLLYFQFGVQKVRGVGDTASCFSLRDAVYIIRVHVQAFSLYLYPFLCSLSSGAFSLFGRKKGTDKMSQAGG